MDGGVFREKFFFDLCFFFCEVKTQSKSIFNFRLRFKTTNQFSVSNYDFFFLPLLGFSPHIRVYNPEVAEYVAFCWYFLATAFKGLSGFRI